MNLYDIAEREYIATAAASLDDKLARLNEIERALCCEPYHPFRKKLVREYLDIWDEIDPRKEQA